MYKLVLLCILMCLAGHILGQINNADSTRAIRSRLDKRLSDTSRIKLQLDLGNLYLFLSAENQKNIDSALILCEQSTYLSDKLHLAKWEKECLKLKGNYYFEIGDLKEGKVCYQQLIEKYYNQRDERKIAMAWLDQGHYMPLWNLNLGEGSATCFEEARNIYKRLKYKQDEISAFKEEADAHLNEGRLDLAENELLQVLAEYKAIHYRKLHNTYYQLSALYGLKGDLHKQLFYCLETVKSMEANADTADADNYYAKLALVYSDLGMYDQSLTQISKSLQIIKNSKRFGDFYGDLSLVIYLLIKEGKASEALACLKKNVKEVPPINLAQKVDMNEEFGNCYKNLKQYNKAERYYLEMLRLFRITAFNKVFYSDSRQMYIDYIYYYETLASFYILTKQFSKANFYVDKILGLPKDVVRPISLCKFQLMKFKVDSAMGNYVSGIKHFELGKKLTDSIFNATKSKQIEELQISYETSKKDRDIQLLKKQSLIGQVRLERKKMMGNLELASLAFLLIILGVLYNRYQLKKRNVSLLQEKQKEVSTKNIALEQMLRNNEWLLREVHHRVKNNLQIVMSLLHSQSAYLKDEKALHAVMDSQHRVQAMSLIHQKLYKSDNSTSIYMPEYIGELIDYLKDSFKIELRIFLRLEIAPIFLDVLHAVPVGLILNEIITNSLKYAFPHTENDTITVRLFCAADGEVSLYIADNGRGLPKGFDIKNTNSFGMLLVKGLIEDLGGTFVIQSINGTVLSTNFNIVPLTESEIIFT